MEVQLPPAENPTVKATSRRRKTPLVNPFRIVVDTAEQNGFTFDGIYADSDRDNCQIVIAPGINLIRQCLGRHPNSLGDYSIEGYVGRVAIERKSQDDAYGTILDFSVDQSGTSRRSRFERELFNLNNTECALVVVECESEERFLNEAPEYDQGHKTARLNRKILARSLISFRQQFSSVQWFFGTRRVAEVYAFRWMERYFEKMRPKRTRKSR